LSCRKRRLKLDRLEKPTVGLHEQAAGLADAQLVDVGDERAAGGAFEEAAEGGGAEVRDGGRVGLGERFGQVTVDILADAIDALAVGRGGLGEESLAGQRGDVAGGG